MSAGAPRPADPQLRLHAFVADHTLGVVAGAAAALGAGLLGGASATTAGAAGVVVVLLVWAGLGAVAGRTGTGPGRALHRVRLVDASSGEPVGAARGALRAVALGVGGWGTLGAGWLALGLSVARDPAAAGRGWHDRLLGTRVDAQRAPRPEATCGAGAGERTPVPGSRDVVDLTALRQHAGAAPARSEGVVVPAPRAPAPRVLPGRWQVEVDGGAVHEVVDRLQWSGVEFARMPDGALVLRDLGAPGGALLVRGGAARTLAAGQVSTLLPGDRVRVGQRWMRVAGPGVNAVAGAATDRLRWG